MDNFVYNCMLAEQVSDDKTRESLEYAIKTVNAGKGSWCVDLAGTYYKMITGVNAEPSVPYREFINKDENDVVMSAACAFAFFVVRKPFPKWNFALGCLVAQQILKLEDAGTVVIPYADYVNPVNALLKIGIELNKDYVIADMDMYADEHNMMLDEMMKMVVSTVPLLLRKDTRMDTAVTYWLRYKYEADTIFGKWEDWDNVRS